MRGYEFKKVKHIIMVTESQVSVNEARRVKYCYNKLSVINVAPVRCCSEIPVSPLTT